MTRRSIFLSTQNRADQRALEAIFQEEIGLGEVEVKSFLTSSAALGVAEYSLLEDPDRPVALVVNAEEESPEEIEDRRATIHRILCRAAPTGWHVSLAMPDVDECLRADPAIRAIFDSDEVTRRSRHERAVRIGEIAKQTPVNREAIGRSHPDFRSLVEFIRSHRPVMQPNA